MATLSEQMGYSTGEKIAFAMTVLSVLVIIVVIALILLGADNLALWATGIIS